MAARCSRRSAAARQQTGQRCGQNFGIDQIVLQRLVGRAALDNEAQRIGLSVGDEQVARDIRAVAAFQGVDGEFDRESYEFVLDRNGLTPGQFEEQIRADTARGLLQAAVAGGVAIPQVYRRHALRLCPRASRHDLGGD